MWRRVGDNAFCLFGGSEDETEYVGGVVGEAIAAEKSAEVLDIFACGDDGRFDVIGAEGLA